MRILECGIHYAFDSFGNKGFRIDFINDSQKTIKYIDVVAYPVNRVGDVVSCSHNKKSTVSGRYTGPISPHTGHVSQRNCTTIGSSSFWQDSAICKVVIQYILITYMDGTTEEYFESDIPTLIAPITKEEKAKTNKATTMRVIGFLLSFCAVLAVIIIVAWYIAMLLV